MDFGGLFDWKRRCCATIDELLFETDAYIFLTIFDDTTGTTAFSDTFLLPTTTSILLPGGTLAAGNSYRYEIDYSDRDAVAGTGGAYDPEIGFDTRTDGTFTTAAVAPTPEPPSLVLCGSAMLLMAFCMKRKLFV
ncbi:MAG: hypothetical protein WBY53_07795 [Acidobacteriaceae bacterium]